MINVGGSGGGGLDDVNKTTLDSDMMNLGSNLLSGKTNKSQLDGLMKPFIIGEHHQQRRERS